MKQHFKRSFGDAALYWVGAVIVRLDKVAFGWWLDEVFYRRDRARFLREIEAAFSELMERHGGKIVPHEGEELPRGFDYVGVTIEFTSVRFRLIRGRGELRTQVARPDEPHKWEELTRLWTRMAAPECGSPLSAFDQLGELAIRLETCWDRLLAMLAHPNG